MNTKNFRYYNYAQDTDTVYIELKRAGMYCDQFIGHYNRGENILYLNDTNIVRNRLGKLAQHFNITMDNYKFSNSLMGFNSWQVALSFKPTVKRNGMQYYKMIGE